MRRLAVGLALVLALALSRAPVQAQGTPTTPTPPAPQTPAPAAQPAPLRVAVDVNCEVEGAAESTNSFQYIVWERLNAFGLRVDSVRPVGDARLDGFVTRAAEKWTTRQPDQAAASLQVVGRSACDYANAAFFGQAQAHTFKGRVDVELKDASGAVLATLGLAHEWGRLPQNYTKSKTKQEYHQMVHLAVVVWLLHQPQVLEGVPEAKRAELTTFIAETKTRILRPLEEQQIECEVRTLLNGLTAPAVAPAPGGRGATPPAGGR